MTKSQPQSKKLQGYITLSQLAYEDAVQFLLNKYGPAKDDYFREASYQRFLNGEIKAPAKGKYSRGGEGLYAHHIAEIENINLAGSIFIKYFEYPFELQKKSGLVYCDIFEHLILHAIIVHETDGVFGIGGYAGFLLPMVKDWYIQGNLPKPKWMQTAYQRAFMTANETQQLIDLLKENLVGDALEEFEAFELLNANTVKQDKPDTMKLWFDRVTNRLDQIPLSYFQPWVILNGKRSNPKLSKAVDAMANYCDTTCGEITDDKFEEIFQKRFAKYFNYDARLELVRQKEAAKKQRIQSAIDRERQEANKNAIHHEIDVLDVLAKFEIDSSTSRDAILWQIYSRKSSDIYPKFEDFKLSRVNFTRDKLLAELAQLLLNQ